MGRLRERFELLKRRGERALVSYLMVGFPDYTTSLKAFHTVLENGTDILEIGFPFSDPVADGPTLQLAHETALKMGIRSEHVFQIARDLRETHPNIPFLLMTYYNPIFRIGHERFCGLAKENGIDGFIVPDLPPEECGPLKEVMGRYGLSLVLLASPTSPRERLELICRESDEMVYFVSVTGTTGARDDLPLQNIRGRVELYRDVCSKPVVVGFGVSKGEQVRRLSEFADGVVVGSFLVKLVADGKLRELAEKVRELKEGTIIR